MSWYDNGMPVTNDPDVLCTAELIKRLYAMPEGANGGPLHVIVEDGNTGDEHVHDSDYFGCADGRTTETYLCKRGEGTWVAGAYHHAFVDELYCSEETADLCRLILASFRRMPEPWRAAAIAWADGTIAQNLPILHDNPKAACEASPEQVDDFIAELHQWIEQGEVSAPKACVSIPCPPFVPFPAIQGVEQMRYEQSIDYPGVKVTKLDGEGNPVGEPTLVGGWADVGFQVSPLESGEIRPTLKWVETTIKLADGITPDLWQALYGGEWPTFDLEQVRNEPPKVAPIAPVFVELPEGVDSDGMSAAIELCRRAGLLNSPAGYVLFPPGMTRP